MPQVRFTASFLQSVRPVDGKGAWYSEAGGKGLRLYVGASGKKTWFLNYRLPGQTKVAQYKIGDADLFSVPQARDAAREFLAAVARGETPWVRPEVPGKLSLEEFVRDVYGPWVVEHRRTGAATVALIESSFAPLLRRPVDEITVGVVEQWRTRARRERDLKASSINRQITALKAALNWAVKRGILEANPMARLETLREEDSERKVRYLSEEERERLFAALDAREKRVKTERESYNKWCKERKLAPLPDLKKVAFVDHLKPMIVVSLNTGIRRGSLLQLRWSDIDLKEGVLTVRAAAAKNQKTLHVPLNATAAKTLAAWRKQTGASGDSLVFPSPKTGGVMDNCASAWEKLLEDAAIKDFRWHDMRHDFASQLVMKGADLNTVRELLGHADMKMTLRYAHLAPKVKRAAVGLLG